MLRALVAGAVGAGLLLLAAPPCLAARPGEPWPAMAPEISAAIAEASERFGIPAELLAAVVRAESGGNPRAVSPKGAMGLMQLMPGTWTMLRERLGLGDDPFAVRENLLAGAAYLRELHDRFGDAEYLAAYNAGPERLRASRAAGRPLPAETRAYLRRVGSMSERLDPPRSWQTSAIFPERPAAALAAPAW